MDNRMGRLWMVAAVLVAAVVLVACGGGAPADPVPVEEPAVEEPVAEAPEVEEQEPAAEEDAAAEEEPTAEEAPQVDGPDFAADNPLAEQFPISLNYARESPNLNGDDGKWVLVQAGISNNSGIEFTVAPQMLILVDTDGNRYEPDPVDARTRPALLDTVVPDEFSGFGVVRYTVPEESQPFYIEYCPTGNCGETPILLDLKLVNP